MERRLAAILAADVVDYTRLMGEDLTGTLVALREVRDNMLLPAVDACRGKLVKSMGDGWLVEFPSVSDAVTCAVDVQERLAEGHMIRIRCGIHIGDVIFESEDVFGDGVNIASRLETIALPGEVLISDTAHQSLDGKLAAMFCGGETRPLKNVARQIAVWHWPKRETGEMTTPVKSLAERRYRLPLHNVPSLAVLPFENLSDDREQELFADGLVDDLITSLSKLSGLRVIARNSTFLYKGKSVSLAELAKTLRVQYVLEGSIRKSANRIRISVQLIETSDGSPVWAERYDRDISDIFALQDEITMILATEMQVKLIEGEQARLLYTTTDNVEAWNQWVEGLSHYRQEVRKENVEAAHICWKRALALDPNSAPLNAMLSFVHYVAARFNWWGDKEAALARAKSYIQRALEIDPNDAQAYAVLGMAMLMHRKFDEAADYARRSIRLAPGAADAATFACFTLAFAGHAEEAVAEGERAINLSPNCPPVYLGHLGNAYRLAGRFKEAIAAFKAYHESHPGFGLADLIIIYHQTGQEDLARQLAGELMAIRRDFTIENWASTQNRIDTDQLEADIASLQAAGLPMS